MSEIDYKVMRARAVAYAKYRGMRDEQLCEDFGQEYCLALFEEKSSRLDYSWTDFLRKLFGRHGRRLPTHFYYDDISESPEGISVDFEVNILVSELRKYASQLKGNRALIVGLYLQGRSQMEIAETLGVNPATICIQLKDIVLKLRKKMC